MRKPSPAMVIALIALLVALTGTSSAAISGIGQLTNKITSAQIKDGSIKSADIGRSQVKAEDISPGSVKASDLGKDQVTNDKLADKSVRGNNIAPDTITGANVVESTLQQVASALAADRAQTAGQADSAARADRAGRADSAGNADTVSGNGVRTFRFEGSNADPSERTILELGGMRLRAGCASDDIDFFVQNVSGQVATAVYTEFASGQVDSHFAGEVPTPDGINLALNPYDDNATGHFTFKTASHVVTVSYSLNEEPTTPRCSITGTAVGG